MLYCEYNTRVAFEIVTLKNCGVRETMYDSLAMLKPQLRVGLMDL